MSVGVCECECECVISVVVAYAIAERQIEIAICVMKNCTIESAIHQSNIISQFPEIDLSKNPVGIFSRRVTLNTIVRDGDRIEIYRPLMIDPKQARRLKASR